MFAIGGSLLLFLLLTCKNGLFMLLGGSYCPFRTMEGSEGRSCSIAALEIF